MTDHPTQHEGELILYRTADDAVRVELLYESETSWLDQRRMAELSGVDVRTVNEHMPNIFDRGEQTLHEAIVNGFVLEERLKLHKRFGRVSQNPVEEW